MLVHTVVALCGMMVAAAPVTTAPATGASGLKGEYVEARTSDVFTGPCFSNAEVYITGNQAVVAWKVTEGSFNGQNLSGLTVAAAVRGNSTFDADAPEQAESVLIVDNRATAAQRDALVAMAKTLGGERLKRVVAVKSSPMSLVIESGHATDEHSAADAEHSRHAMPKAPRALFLAPGLAEISTRPLDDRDHKCGNEVLAYTPISKGVEVLPAFTLGNFFKGEELNTRWDDPNARSSMVGKFAL